MESKNGKMPADGEKNRDCGTAMGTVGFVS
jgi:hypothetical protein